MAASARSLLAAPPRGERDPGRRLTPEPAASSDAANPSAREISGEAFAL